MRRMFPGEADAAVDLNRGPGRGDRSVECGRGGEIGQAAKCGRVFELKPITT